MYHPIQTYTSFMSFPKVTASPVIPSVCDAWLANRYNKILNCSVLTQSLWLQCVWFRWEMPSGHLFSSYNSLGSLLQRANMQRPLKIIFQDQTCGFCYFAPLGNFRIQAKYNGNAFMTFFLWISAFMWNIMVFKVPLFVHLNNSLMFSTTETCFLFPHFVPKHTQCLLPFELYVNKHEWTLFTRVLRHFILEIWRFFALLLIGLRAVAIMDVSIQ